MKGSESK